MIISIVFIILGAYCIFSGIKILLTGRLSKNEEAKISNYSNKGARTYKLMNVLISIVAGLGIIAQSVLEILESQKILGETMMYRMIIWGVIIVIIVIYFIVISKCKKMTDDE